MNYNIYEEPRVTVGRFLGLTVKNLIEELNKYDENLPVCINDFIETLEYNIKVEKKKYITFPFTRGDEFDYVNLKN